MGCPECPVCMDPVVGVSSIIDGWMMYRDLHVRMLAVRSFIVVVLIER